jgi:hypothetical protein
MKSIFLSSFSSVASRYYRTALSETAKHKVMQKKTASEKVSALQQLHNAM